MAGFRSEADMLYTLIERISTLIAPLSGNFHTFFEVQSAAGKPDVVLVAFDEEELANRQRRRLPPITDLPDIAVLALLGAPSGGGNSEPWGPAQLARATGLSAGYLSSTVLQRLAENGYVRRIARGQWISLYPYAPPARHVICIETKLVDWRRGYWQARRQAADYTWLVMDQTGSRSTIAHADKFSAARVGLATLSTSAGMQVISPASYRAPPLLHRNLLIERVTAMFLDGRVSGPLHSVFGRNLVATTGVDPRLQDVAVR